MSQEPQLDKRVAIVVGAGQTPGETVGNGRAAALVYAREGAHLLLVDRDSERLTETLDLVRSAGGSAEAYLADVLVPTDCSGIAQAALQHFHRIDILHYNVGRSEGDAEPGALDVAQWDEIMNLNLRGFVLCCRAVLPVMRRQSAGSILGISSAAAIASGSTAAYKASKAGMNALVQSMAVQNGKYGIRVNAIMPGLMDTPMAIERRTRESGVSRDQIRTARHRQVPLSTVIGTAWDVAEAALFLVSDRAKYISGIALAVDGALSARVG